LGFFKLQIVLPLVVLFLVWRRWRFSAGFLITAVATTLLSIWVVGSLQARAYARALFLGSTGSVSWEKQFRYPMPITEMANLHGLIFGGCVAFASAANTRISGFFVQAATVSVSALVFGAVAVLTPRGRRGSDDLLVGITVSALVSYYLLIHDLSILFLPVVITMSRYLPAEATGDRTGRRLVRTAALMFAAPMCFSYIPFYFYVVAVPALAFLFALVTAGRLEEGGMWKWNQRQIPSK
jgi:hypothetical protein